MMRTLGDYVLTILSMALAVGIARFLFEKAAIIQFHHPVEAAQLVTLGWGVIAVTVVVSIGANWIRARERQRERDQVTSDIAVAEEVIDRAVDRYRLERRASR